MHGRFFNKKIMTRFLLSMLIAFILSGQAFSASLVSSVDRHQIGEDETLNLTITLNDASFSGSPDLAGLDSNFQILNSRSGSSTTIINGSYTSKKEWHYTLLPKSTGKLLIPSFKLKNVFTDAIEIEVTANGIANKNNSTDGEASTTQRGDLFLEQNIDKTEAYIQERMTLTLRIFTAIEIARPEMPDPALPNFMIEKLGQAEYQSKQNGRNYYVLEYKYGLFPNKSGKVVLPKQRYQISQVISNGPRSMFNIPGFDAPNTQARFLSTPEITFNIKPQPDNLPANYWLPSEDVSISDNWPEQQTVDVGTPLTRAIEIKALGNLAAHIPPLPVLNLGGLKSYAEQPELNNARSGDNLLGTRKENIAIVPIEPGTYILPAIQLHWWDTKSKQFKISTLPERSLTVKANAAAVPSSSTQAPTTSQQPELQNPTTSVDSAWVNSISDAATSSTPFYMSVYIWMGAAAFFVILWIVTLVVMLSRKNNNSSETLSASETMRQQSLREAFKQLKAACQINDAKKAREALIHWAQLQWQDSSILTLQHVKQHTNKDQFSKLADELDGTLYRDAANWNGKAMLDFLQIEKFNASTTNDETTLPKLYS